MVRQLRLCKEMDNNQGQGTLPPQNGYGQSQRLFKPPRRPPQAWSAPGRREMDIIQGQGTLPPQNGYGQSLAPVQNPQYRQAPNSVPQTPDFSHPTPENTGFAGDNNPNVSTLEYRCVQSIRKSICWRKPVGHL